MELLKNKTFETTLNKYINQILADNKIDTSDIPAIFKAIVYIYTSIKKLVATKKDTGLLIKQLFVKTIKTNEKFMELPDDQQELIIILINLCVPMAISALPHIKNFFKKFWLTVVCCGCRSIEKFDIAVQTGSDSNDNINVDVDIKIKKKEKLKQLSDRTLTKITNKLVKKIDLNKIKSRAEDNITLKPLPPKISIKTNATVITNIIKAQPNFTKGTISSLNKRNSEPILPVHELTVNTSEQSDRESPQENNSPDFAIIIKKTQNEVFESPSGSNPTPNPSDDDPSLTQSAGTVVGVIANKTISFIVEKTIKTATLGLGEGVGRMLGDGIGEAVGFGVKSLVNAFASSDDKEEIEVEKPIKTKSVEVVKEENIKPQKTKSVEIKKTTTKIQKKQPINFIARNINKTKVAR
jgi:hypothetical protein